MSDGSTRPDPYTESGRHAAVLRRTRRTKAALVASIEDAKDLEFHGHRVIARGGRSMVFAGAMVLAAVGGGLLVGTVAFGSYDGSYEGSVRANWLLLLSVFGMMCGQFAWIWFVKSHELRQTGRRLLRRSEYQRSLASFELKKAERSNHETLR